MYWFVLTITFDWSRGDISSASQVVRQPATEACYCPSFTEQPACGCSDSRAGWVATEHGQVVIKQRLKQVRSQVLTLVGGKIHFRGKIFVFIIRLKKISGHKKFWRPRGYGPGLKAPCAGGRLIFWTMPDHLSITYNSINIRLGHIYSVLGYVPRHKDVAVLIFSASEPVKVYFTIAPMH